MSARKVRLHAHYAVARSPSSRPTGVKDPFRSGYDKKSNSYHGQKGLLSSCP